MLARHGGDLAPDALAVADEQRADEVIDGEARLADHPAEGRIGPQSTHAVGRISHELTPKGPRACRV